MKNAVIIIMAVSISLLLPSRTWGEVIFEDDFSSGNLNNWTILGGTGSWDVVNGEMWGHINDCEISPNTETLTSYTFKTDCRFEGGLAWGIDFRYIDPYNRVRLDFAPGAPDQLNVNIYENGVHVAQPYAGTCSQYGTYVQHYCEFVVDGSYFEVYFGNDPGNLDLLCTYTYEPFDAGTIKYHVWGYEPTVSSYFDNVLVTTDDEWILIYEEDFSSDPGWMTNNGSHFYWNSSEENYYVHIEDDLNEYGVIQVPEMDGSFKIEYDAKMTQNDWSSALIFGLYDDEIAYKPGGVLDTLSSLVLMFDHADGGTGFTILSYTPPTIGNYHNDWCGTSLNQWYHVVIEYDAEVSTASYVVTLDGSIVSSYSINITGSYQGLTYLGVSRRWHYYVQGATTAGYVDNVELWVLGPPPPPLTVTYPNGGEVWQIGDTPTITWTHEGGFDSFDILLSRDNGGGWETLDTGLYGFAIDWTWNAGVTPPPSNECLVKIVGHYGADQTADSSDAVFSITGESPFTPDEFTKALWHFDEASGTYTAYDATGNGYDMSLEDGAEFTASGYFSGAVDLNDPDAKVNSAHLIGNGWDAMTIDAFIFPTEITGPEHPIVERYRWHNVADPSYYLTVLQDGSLVGGVYLNDPGSVYSRATTPPGTIETDQWYHVAMTWSSGEPTRIFLNGEMIAESQQVHEGTVRAGDDPLTIGWFHDEGYGDFYFQGTIDEVRISDIDRYPVQPGAPFEPDEFTEALWHFDEASGTYTAYDATGNGYDMALEDGAEFTVSGYFNGAVDLNDPDAKVNSSHIIGTGWDALTIDAHIFAAVIDGSHPIVCRQNWHNVGDPSFYFYLLENAELYAGVYMNDPGTEYSNVMTSAGVIEIGQWYHVAMTWSSGQPVRIFVDDMVNPVVTGTEMDVGTVRPGDDPLTVGCNWEEVYGWKYFQGFIDEVRISDIDRYPVQPGPPFEPDEFTYGLWHFDEAPGTYVAYDASGYNHDMNLEDGAEFTENGFFANGVDLVDPDGKISSDYTIGNGWEAITIDAWIYAESWTGDEQPIVCRTDWYNVSDVSYYFHTRPDGIIAGGVWCNEVGTEYADAVSDPGAVQLNTWHRVALTWSSGEPVRIYVDDMTTPVVQSPQEPEGYVRHSTDPLLIGCNYYNVYGWFYWDGTIDEVRISNIDRYGEPPPPPPLEITITPYNPPIVIPPGGDAFAFNVAFANNGNEPTTFDVWVNIEVPGGYQFPVAGPVYDIVLAAGSSIERDRTVFVPGNAPAGEYACIGMIGTYPWTVFDSDTFPFIKEGSDGIWEGSEGWICTGEPFPGEAAAEDDALPEEFALLGAYPNPFNPLTTIRFGLPIASWVKLDVFDISGRMIRAHSRAPLLNGWRDAGFHEVVFDGSKMASGLYFYRIETGEFKAVKKMVLMK